MLVYVLDELNHLLITDAGRYQMILVKIAKLIGNKLKHLYINRFGQHLVHA